MYKILIILANLSLVLSMQFEIKVIPHFMLALFTMKLYKKFPAAGFYFGHLCLDAEIILLLGI